MNTAHRTVVSFAFLPLMLFGGWNFINQPQTVAASEESARSAHIERVTAFQEWKKSWYDARRLWHDSRDQLPQHQPTDTVTINPQQPPAPAPTYVEYPAATPDPKPATYPDPVQPTQTNTVTTPAPTSDLTNAVTDLPVGTDAKVPDMQKADQTLPLVLTSSPSTATRGKVSFNFDDGWQDAYENGISILNGKGMPVTDYIITRSLKDYDFSGYMTVQEVKDLAARGNEVGAHTQNHPHLKTLDDQRLNSEIRSSIQDLAAMGVSATTFAYPYGEYDARVREAAVSAGLAAARTTNNGYASDQTDHFVLPSFDMNSKVTFEHVKEILDKAKEHDAWVILVFHHVGKTGNEEQNVSPELVRQIADYVQGQNIKVITTAQGVAELNAAH